MNIPWYFAEETAKVYHEEYKRQITDIEDEADHAQDRNAKLTAETIPLVIEPTLEPVHFVPMSVYEKFKQAKIFMESVIPNASAELPRVRHHILKGAKFQDLSELCGTG